MEDTPRNSSGGEHGQQSPQGAHPLQADAAEGADRAPSKTTTEADRHDSSLKETKKPGKEEEARKAGRRRNTVFATTIGLASLLAFILWVLISRMSDPARVFAALLAVAGYLVVSGFVFLVVVIPAAGSNPEVKTEFYSARAAYFCVIGGLVLIGFVTIGILFALIMTGTGGRYVPGTK